MAEERLEYREDTELERRRRRIKILTIVLLLLLLALLVLLFFYFRPLVRPFARRPLQFLFAIYGLNKPLSVSTDSNNNIYVSDTGNSRFMVFDRQGELVRRIGKGRGKDKLYGVYGSFVDEKEKRVYIADWTRRAVHVFTLRGRLLFRFPKNPRAVAFGPLGFTPFDLDMYKKKLYITSNNGIYLFTKEGEFLERWGQRGKDIGSYDFPNGIAVDKKTGTVYVADVLNRRVVAVKDGNTVLWMLGKPDEEGQIVGFFALPRDVAVDKKGRIYITDTFRNQIVIVNRRGRLISKVGRRGTRDARFNFPEGIAITRDDVVYIADRENGRVQALRIGRLPRPSTLDLEKANTSYTGPKPGGR